MSELGLFDLLFGTATPRNGEQNRQEWRHVNRQAYLNRISDNVERFRQRYADMLDDLHRQGLDAWVQQEYDELCGMLDNLDQLIDDGKVEEARYLSFEIGESIHGIFTRARLAKSRAEHQERQLAREEQERRNAELRRQSRLDFIEQMKNDLQAGSENDSPAVREAVQQLESLKREAPVLPEEDLLKRMGKEMEKADREIAAETVRRKSIQAIYQSLRKAGFLVDAPRLEGDSVLLRARKPAGQRVEFSLKIDGSGSYKFDNYEGQMCRKDLGEVTALLAECYGIRLDKTSFQWSNPDRIQKGARDNPAGGGIRAGADRNG